MCGVYGDVTGKSGLNNKCISKEAQY